MKIEYLASGSPDCPIIRIYGTDQDEYKQFFDTVRSLADGSNETTSTDLIFGKVNPLNVILSTDLSGTPDETIKMTNESSCSWTLSCKAWHEVSNLLRAFTSHPKLGTHQWLGGDTAEEISILISYSPDGRWRPHFCNPTPQPE